MFERIHKLLGEQGDLVLVLGIVSILVVLFTPIPSSLLDFLLLTNLSFALLILLLTFYMGKPLEFSTFPSLLLIATLFRLALNISATRLILSDADAGRVIGAIGNYVVGGNYVIGLIVFLVLVVVQYVVVTNGAQRVAEVAARFTLDSMPGKQMSIDADMNMGLIDEHEARERRKGIEKEANFYGAMDGASRFVKGDAIAGIIIILIDIIGGLTIGIAQRGMPWGEALHTFTLLTIGDGIVTQVPALVIATGTGIIVTRAATDAQLSNEISSQITSYPKTLILAILGLFIVLFLPGIPVFPVAILLAILGAVAWVAYRVRGMVADKVEPEDGKRQAEAEDIYSLMAVEPIEVAIGQNLIPMFGGSDGLFMDRISTFRKQYALDMGFVIPKVRIRDDKQIPPNGYEIRFYGTSAGKGEVLEDHVLAISPSGETVKLEGIQTKDPTYGLPAVWILDKEREKAKASGYTLVGPSTVLMTHLSEEIKKHASSLLTRGECEHLVNRVKQKQQSLVDDLIPGVLNIGEVQKVLQNLLQEKVSIRNIEKILETLADNGGKNKDPDFLTELVRQQLGPSICQSLTSSEGELFVLTLDPTIEHSISSGIRTHENQSTLVLDPSLAEQLLKQISGESDKMLNSSLAPVLLCPPSIRRHVRKLTERIVPHLAIVSLSEIPNNVHLKSFGLVSV